MTKQVKLNTNKQSLNKQDFSTLRRYNYSDDVKNGIAYYGKNNDLPQKYLNLLDDSAQNSVSSTWHSTAMEAIVRYVQGDGLATSNDSELPLANDFGQTLQEVFEPAVWDYKLYGGFSLEVIWNNESIIGGEPKIAEIYHIPWKDLRAKEKNYRGVIEGWYVSNRWTKGANRAKSPKDENVEYIPRFNPKAASYQENDLGDVVIAAQPKQLLVVKRHNPASEYYPEPDYKGALEDIMIDSHSRQFKVNKLRNDIGCNLIIQIIGEMEAEMFAEISNDVQEQYQGAIKAGTPMILNAATAADAHQFIQPTNQKGSAETYNSYSDDARIRILAAHGISREILDVDDSSSLFGDNKREKYQTFLNTTIRDLQMPMLSGFNKLMPYWVGEGIDLQINPIDIFAGEFGPQSNIVDEETDTNNLLNPET